MVHSPIIHLARAQRPMMHRIRVADTGAEEAAHPGGAPAEIHEIERVSALLQSVQPDLEMWREGAAARENGRPSPAWLAIGVVWVATLLLIGLAVGGVAILLR